MKRVFWLLIIAIFTVANQGCIKDNFDFSKLSKDLSFNPTLNSPLAYGSLNLGDLIKPDDSLIYYNENQTIYLLTREDSVFDFKVSDFLRIPDQDYLTTVFELEAAKISVSPIDAQVTLDTLIEYMDPSIAAVFNFLNGQYGFFPAFSQNNLGAYQFDLVEQLKYVEFSQGKLIVALENHLPVDIQSLEITIWNRIDNNPAIIGTLTFQNLPTLEITTDTLNLAGLYIENQFIITIDQLQVNQSTEPVFINLEDFLLFTMNTEDAKVIKGEALIPTQVVHQQTKNFVLSFSGSAGGDEQITKLQLNHAVLDYIAQLYTDDTFIISATLPYSTSNGSPLSFQVQVSGSGGMVSGNWSMSNVLFDLSSDPMHPYNIFPVQYEITYVSPGYMIVFDLSEPILRTIEIRMIDVDFDRVEGYFGKKIIALDDELFDFNLDFINKITGTSTIANPVIKLFYEHSFGFPIQLDMQLKGLANNQATYLLPPQINLLTPQNFDEIVSDTITITKNNSNIVDFISGRPADVYLVGDAISNPSGQVVHTNFIKADSKIRAGFEFKMPLELQQLDLVMVDTFALNLNSFFQENIESMVLNLTIQNGFPMNAVVNLDLYDSGSGSIVHSYNQIALLNAAPVNNEGLVPPGQRAQSVVELLIPPSVANQLYRVDNMILTARLTLPAQSQTAVKLVTSYAIDFQISSKTRLNF